MRKLHWFGGCCVLHLIFISAIVVSSIYIHAGCDERKSECIVERNDRVCTIRYDDPDIPVQCPYTGSECSKDENVTVDCYYRDASRLDIRCPNTKCMNIGAMLGLVFAISFEFSALMMLPMGSMWYN